jgi:hypothetical protein|tara:strand:- start:150 stop:440 length:291 start_codon:yes stop_codon:yes gene_type:complete
VLDKDIKPNAYDFFDIREAKSAPKHFEFCSIHPKYNMEDSIRKWIKANLKGRFYIGRTLVLSDNQNRAYNQTIKIGFEQHRELSYFMLACPHLKYN